MERSTDQNLSCHLDHLILLTVTGEEAQAFLQSQLTSDVKALKADHTAQYTAYCTPKGRMLANGYLFWLNDQHYGWIMHRGVADRLLKRLSMFVLRSKVKLAFSDWKLAGTLISDSASEQSLNVMQATDNTIELRLPQHRLCTIYASDAQPSKLHFDQSEQDKTFAQWRAYSIAADEVLVDDHLYEELIPQMIEWDRLKGVSFKKGCYPGQEIVARSHYLGKMKRRLFSALIEGSAPIVGTPIVKQNNPEQSIGVVAESTVQAHQSLLLAVLSTDFVNAETPLALKEDTPPLRALHSLSPRFPREAASEKTSKVS